MHCCCVSSLQAMIARERVHGQVARSAHGITQRGYQELLVTFNQIGGSEIFAFNQIGGSEFLLHSIKLGIERVVGTGR